MYHYPFFGFPSFRKFGSSPFYFYNRPFNANTTNYNTNSSNKNEFYNDAKFNNSANCKELNYKNFNNDKKKNNQTVEDENSNYFDFFGIRLATDDLLILALLFFLYKEDTKDPYIFIALILLLLS